MEVNIGDRVWMFCGTSLMVGHLLEVSPDGSMVALSPIPFDEFSKLNLVQRASVPVNWCPLKYSQYVGHTTYDEIKKINEILSAPKGFGFISSQAITT